jgi:hypothetical protein
MRIFSSFLAVVSVMVLFAGQSWANPKCHDVVAETSISATDPLLIFGKFVGTALISIDGQTPIPSAVSFKMTKVKVGDDGTLHPTDTMTFDFGPMGTLTVQDTAVLSPTEPPYIYAMNSRLDNLVGTGMFAGAFGKLLGHGQFSFATLTVTAKANGRICW